MKARHIAISLAALLLCTLSQAQTNIGVKGGFSGGWTNGVALLPGARVVPHPSLYGGIYGNVLFGDNLIAQLELLYAGKGHSEYTVSDLGKNNYALNMGYLQIPAMFGVNLADGKCSVMAGPELGILLHAREISRTSGPAVEKDIVVKNDYREYCNAASFGIGIQANYMVLPNLGIDVKFDWGLSRVFKSEILETLGFKTNAHQLSAQIGICYNIEL